MYVWQCLMGSVLQGLHCPLSLPQDEEYARQLQSELDTMSDAQQLEEETSQDEMAEDIVSTCHNV